jgi:glyoxylase-like metal-dependent hydrolase (beta-lactamase superfamily II)
LVDNEIAIVGDAMFGIFRKSVSSPYADNPTLMMNSWRILLNTDCDTFLPGHGKQIDREILQKEYNKYARKYKSPKVNFPWVYVITILTTLVINLDQKESPIISLTCMD